jgi:hypothetical protein
VARLIAGDFRFCANRLLNLICAASWPKRLDFAKPGARSLAADAGNRSQLAQQLRQLGDVRSDAPRLSEKLVERHWQWLASICC